MANEKGNDNTTLSIRVHTDGFCFLREATGMAPVWEQQAANAAQSPFLNLKQFIDTHQLSQTDGATVNILLIPKHYILFPHELFGEKDAQAIYRHSFPFMKVEEEVMCTPLECSQAMLLYTMDKYCHELLEQSFRGARYHTHIGLLLKHIYSHCKTGKLMTAYLHEGQADLIAYNNRKLEFVNEFSYQHTDDALYYLLSVWKMLQFSQEEDELQIIGEPFMASELKSSVEKFIPHSNAEPIPLGQQPFDLTLLQTSCE